MLLWNLTKIVTSNLIDINNFHWAIALKAGEFFKKKLTDQKGHTISPGNFVNYKIWSQMLQNNADRISLLAVWGVEHVTCRSQVLSV